jgi:hypothetical protein
MSENSSGGAGMGMVVGALVVLVLIIGGFVFLGGGKMFGTSHKTVDVNVSAPQLPSAPKAN